MQVLIFTSPTCGPCKTLKPLLMGMAVTHNFNCTTVQASAETQAEFLKHNVRAVPTVVVLNDGGEDVGRFTGLKTEEALFKFLKDCAVIE